MEVGNRSKVREGECLRLRGCYPVGRRSLYGNSRCDEFVDALAIDDVILLGRGDHAWGVLKIVAIFDEPGSTADRYLFNLKTVAN